jgi:predicted methyltransferase
MIRALACCLVLFSAAHAEKLDKTTEALLDAAIAGAHRSDENKARDAFRHPKETLAFFGLRADMTVVEIWPGAGWYTQILAPTLKDDGAFIAAQYSPNTAYSYQRRAFGSFMTMLGGAPDLYRDVRVTSFGHPYELKIAEPDSVDMVLTFRNVHNWVGELYPDGNFAPLAFRAFYDALKPGGVLGITDHRWDDAATEDALSKNGYISEARVIALAEAAGFKLAGRSEINANPKDARNYEKGVWTLPPVLANGDKDRDAMLAIGESDRMTLKFVKPAN